MAVKLVDASKVSATSKVATFSKLQECIQVAVQNGELCLKLPIVGNICVDIPNGIPEGTVAEACASVSFPACVKLTVKVAGQTVVDQSFGAC